MKLILNLLMIGSFVISPSFAQTAKLKRKFDVQRDETVRVAGTNLEIKALGAGHDTYVDWSHTYFCKIEARMNGEIKERELNLGESLTFGNLKIRFVRLKEAYMKDDLTITKSVCGFIVTKN